MKYLYFFLLFFFADLGENPPPIGSLALAEVWMEAETKEIRGGIMFPGSAKLWLEAQPQAENWGCLQISFRVFKIFFFSEQLAGLGVAPPIIWTTALGNNLGHEFYPRGCDVCSWVCVFWYLFWPFLKCCFSTSLTRKTGQSDN